eukprot:TRINITY_DN1470_c0_g1_i1.p1 TRINITY_DN1470_c0_g1~~TRINITY_DN1470_c0_g1_i1.p1  ORF type:complete len:103 (-),score=2.91 TRINITY_DN1470_c0_g1_i1:22-330(-)
MHIQITQLQKILCNFTNQNFQTQKSCRQFYSAQNELQIPLEIAQFIMQHSNSQTRQSQQLKQQENEGVKFVQIRRNTTCSGINDQKKKKKKLKKKKRERKEN